MINRGCEGCLWNGFGKMRGSRFKRVTRALASHAIQPIRQTLSSATKWGGQPV